MITKTKKSWITTTLGICALGACALVLNGCNGDNNNGSPNPSPTVTPVPTAETTYGPAATFGAGTARAYVTTRESVPQEVGIEISKAVLANPASLPLPPAGQVATEVILTPPAALQATTPFVGVSLIYSPGHPPAGQQDVPHFHPTFFLISDAERQALVPNAPGANTPIDAAELPTGFIELPDPNFAYIPSIGTLYFDPTEAGYHEAPFQTALSEFRYFDGHLTALALGTPNRALLQVRDITLPLGVPAKYPKSGYYPTKYHIRADRVSQSYKLSLDDFVQRQ